jgi:hypothetical protein
MEFIAELVTGTARSGAERIAALDHEAGDDAMKDESVVKGLFHLLATPRVGPFLRAFGQTYEIRYGIWGFRLEKLNSKRPFAGRKSCLQHWYAPLVGWSNGDHTLTMLGFEDLRI